MKYEYTHWHFGIWKPVLTAECQPLCIDCCWVIDNPEQTIGDRKETHTSPSTQSKPPSVYREHDSGWQHAPGSPGGGPLASSLDIPNASPESVASPSHLHTSSLVEHELRHHPWRQAQYHGQPDLNKSLHYDETIRKFPQGAPTLAMIWEEILNVRETQGLRVAPYIRIWPLVVRGDPQAWDNALRERNAHPTRADRYVEEPSSELGVLLWHLLVLSRRVYPVDHVGRYSLRHVGPTPSGEYARALRTLLEYYKWTLGGESGDRPTRDSQLYINDLIAKYGAEPSGTPPNCIQKTLQEGTYDVGDEYGYAIHKCITTLVGGIREKFVKIKFPSDIKPFFHGYNGYPMLVFNLGIMKPIEQIFKSVNMQGITEDYFYMAITRIACAAFTAAWNTYATFMGLQDWLTTYRQSFGYPSPSSSCGADGEIRIILGAYHLHEASIELWNLCAEVVVYAAFNSVVAALMSLECINTKDSLEKFSGFDFSPISKSPLGKGTHFECLWVLFLTDQIASPFLSEDELNKLGYNNIENLALKAVNVLNQALNRVSLHRIHLMYMNQYGIIRKIEYRGSQQDVIEDHVKNNMRAYCRTYKYARFIRCYFQINQKKCYLGVRSTLLGRGGLQFDLIFLSKILGGIFDAKSSSSTYFEYPIYLTSNDKVKPFKIVPTNTLSVYTPLAYPTNESIIDRRGDWRTLWQNALDEIFTSMHTSPAVGTDPKIILLDLSCTAVSRNSIANYIYKKIISDESLLVLTHQSLHKVCTGGVDILPMGETCIYTSREEWARKWVMFLDDYEGVDYVSNLTQLYSYALHPLYDNWNMYALGENT